MDNIKVFVNNIYRRKFLNWAINKMLLVLSLSLIVYLFWLFFNKEFYMTPLEWNFSPLTLIFCLIPFLFGKPTIRTTVDFIEKEVKDLKGRLYLITEPYPSALDSPVYKKRATKESTLILNKKDIKELTPLKINFKYLALLGVVTLILIIFSVFSGGIILERISDIPIVTYADSRVEENHSALVLAKSDRLKKMFIFYDGGVKEMIDFGNGKFGIMIKIQKTSPTQVGYRTWKSDPIKIEAIPYLFLSKLILNYKFPAYLEVQSFIDTLYEIENEVLIQALAGTEVRFSGLANRNLGSMEGDINDKSIDGLSFSGSFILKEEKRLRLTLIDSSSFSHYILDFSLNPIKDEPPSIKFISPREEYQLEETMEVPVILHAEDDYGLSSTKLVSGEKEIELAVTWNTKSLEDSLMLEVSNLMPGETLELKGIAVDVAGNKTLSPTILIFMPTLEEIFSEYKALSDTLENYATDIEEREKEIADKIGEFSYKNETGYENQYEIKKTLKEQRDLIESMEKLADIAEKMRIPEISKEINNIKELLDNIHIKEFLNNLDSMMEKPNLSPEELDKLKADQKDLLETLELFRKSLEYLKRLLELNEFSERAEEIYEKQKEITASMPGDSLSNLERELSKELEELLEDMERSAYEKAKNIAREFKKTNTMKEMRELADIIKKGEMDQKSAESIEENLRDLNTSLENAREDNMEEEIRKAIREKGWELGFILRTHNDLTGAKAGLEKGLIEQGLVEALDKVDKELKLLFLKSLAFSPDVFKYLSRAKEKMKALSLELTEKEVPKTSMERINDLIIQAILKLFSPPQQSGEGLAGSIRQIIEQQNSIMNSLSKTMPLPLSSPEMEGYLKRLAERQRQLAEDLRDMGKAFESLASEMEKMANDLERGVQDKKLIERQKKVLDRLLEAEKAIKEGEISSRRHSEPGIFVAPKRVVLPGDLGEEKKNLRELLEKRINEPYPGEYKKEVEDYFRRLVE
jgi:hypothetical protein